MSSKLGRVVLWAGLTAMLVAAAPVSGQSGRTVRMPASQNYDKDRLHQFTFGGGYRELWKTPVDIPVLDLQNEAGGLKPWKRFGGNQTPVLAFKGADGRDYSFRSTDKDPSAVLHPDLQATFIKDIVQDQMAAQHPGAPLVANFITDAAGVLTQAERFVVMPDDPALGEFRETFAGMLGTFFEFPQPVSDTHPGFRGAVEIIGHNELYERLEKGPSTQVDRRQFLRARLVDLMLGDFDRHRKQWRWARFPESPLWQPIPEDRDMAFVRYEGVGPRLGHVYVPILQKYSAEYDDIYGLTLHGWEQDRWLLTGLEWPEWEKIAREIQERVDDEVIREAVAQQPAEYVEIEAQRLTADLTGRRDRLVEAARDFYLRLAGDVDVHATDATESVTVVHDDGGTTVEVRALGNSGSEPVTTYRRRFLADETDEIRVYLRGGADRVVTSGGKGSILVRVVTGDGAGRVDDRAGGATRVYDSGATYEVLEGSCTSVDTRPYTPPASDSPSYLEAEEIPPRDWGYEWYPLPQFSYEDDVGVFLGLSAVFKTYGFRKHPMSTMHTVSAGYATEANRPRVMYDGLYFPENADWFASLELRYSGIDVVGFYGFGNESSDEGRESNYRVRNELFRARPQFELPLPLPVDGFRIWTGPFIEYYRTKDGNRLIDSLDPYGAGRFGMFGANVGFSYDTRRSLPNRTDAPELAPVTRRNPASTYPTEGVFFAVETDVQPNWWDAESWFGSVRGSFSAFYSFDDDARLTLAGRVGGEHVWGTFPYMRAAYIGGGGTVDDDATIRGYRQRRFGGDQSLYGNLDARLFLMRLKLIVPGDLGILFFGDIGRVWYQDDSSDRWHASGGGGIWFAPFIRTNVLSLTVGASDEDTLIYFRNGFHF